MSRIHLHASSPTVARRQRLAAALAGACARPTLGLLIATWAFTPAAG